METNNQQKKKMPTGFYLCIGVAIGSALGVVFKNIAIGVGVGTAIGAALESINRKKNEQK